MLSLSKSLLNNSYNNIKFTPIFKSIKSSIFIYNNYKNNDINLYNKKLFSSNSKDNKDNNNNNVDIEDNDLELEIRKEWKLEKERKKENLHLNKILKDLKDNTSEINQLIKKNRKIISGDNDFEIEENSSGRPLKKRTSPVTFTKIESSELVEKIQIDQVREKRDNDRAEKQLRDSKDPRYYKEIAPGISINPSLSTLNRQQVVVSSTTGEFETESARSMADQLGLDYLPLSQVETTPEQLFQYQLVLMVTPTKTTLNDVEVFESKSGRVRRKLTCEVSLDFTEGQIQFKTEHKTYAKSPMIRAIRGGASTHPETVLDITGGLAKDSWIIASFGSKLTIVERNPILCFLIERALEKAKLDESTREIAERITLIKTDSIEYLVSIINRESSLQPDVIYMDPMYQSKEDDKQALSKKDIRAIRKLVGGDRESRLLFALSKRIAQKRVVWKKPKRVEPIVGIDTSYRSKDTRFDVYITSNKNIKSDNNNNQDKSTTQTSEQQQQPESITFKKGNSKVDIDKEVIL